jgi:hypothetical protein
LERVLVAKEGESFKESGMRSSASNSSTNTSGSGGTTMGVGGAGAASKRGIGKAMTKGGLLFKGKGAGAMQRQEDDVRTRMAQASETFRKAVLESQALRQEYFNFQLPKILRVSFIFAHLPGELLTDRIVVKGMCRRAGHGYPVPFNSIRFPL